MAIVSFCGDRGMKRTATLQSWGYPVVAQTKPGNPKTVVALQNQGSVAWKPPRDELEIKNQRHDPLNTTERA
jgi:hypothetical protein